jgi:hypothetical protein
VKNPEPSRANEGDITQVRVRVYNRHAFPVRVTVEGGFYYEGERINTVTKTVSVGPETGTGFWVTHTGDHAGNVTDLYITKESVRYDG